MCENSENTPCNCVLDPAIAPDEEYQSSHAEFAAKRLPDQKCIAGVISSRADDGEYRPPEQTSAG